MQDQRRLWNRSYSSAADDADETAVSTFAVESGRALPPRCALLELGCGPAADSVFFARAGHRVVAADFAATIMRRNQERLAGEPRLSPILLDISRPLPFRDRAFDAVYARLSLHYFPDAVTRQMFSEIRRVLRPGGALAFMCKSTADPLYGEGDLIETDMFLRDGKVRHFFSEAYARGCLRAGYQIDSLWSGPETVYDGPSHVIRVRATRLA
jgi:SAM-dependent methyltransferase